MTSTSIHFMGVYSLAPSISKNATGKIGRIYVTIRSSNSSMFPDCYNQGWVDRWAGIQIWVEVDGVDERHEVTKVTSNLTGYQTVGLLTPCDQMVCTLEALQFVREKDSKCQGGGQASPGPRLLEMAPTPNAQPLARFYSKLS
ncbi:hypothetical protein CF326_g7172 [Tilletia indica]|nr:hypothetical protein CF326_g7172 [Tilletia indica]